MSTNSKTSRKKSTCKMASPISNDRAEAFVGPQAEVCPRFSEVPSERDARAFDLQAKGMTQRQIAQELKTSQSTVHRGIKKYRFWFGSTLPEDRGELTGFARFRVAVEEQRIFLRHQRELAMEEWHQSRQPVPVKRKRTRLDPEGRKMDGMPIKDIQIDEYTQRRHASAAHLNAAARRSLELTMLEAGYLGVRKLSCDQAIDTDERWRWDRAVKERDTTIAELTRKVAELEAKFAALCPGPSVFGMSDSPLPSTPQPKSPDPLARQPETRAELGAQPRGTGVVGGRVFPLAQPHAPKTPDPDQSHESRTAQTTPVMNQNSPAPELASPIQKASCGDRPDSPQPVSERLNQVNQEHLSGHPAGPATRAEQPPLSAPPPLYRWSDAHRQEALDLHCRVHRLPRAKLSQASGIPGPKNMTPREHVDRGLPYRISIDRSEEEARSWRLGQHRFDERQAEMLRET
jgi:hypothetical protein